MPNLVRRLVREFTPPIVARGSRFVLHRLRLVVGRKDESGEKDAGWYDQAFTNSDAYHCHYTESYYYFLWSVLADRLVQAGVRSVLDLGCGPGQFASLLRDKGIPAYRGIDFSAQAIGMARTVCPDFEFSVLDATKDGALDQAEYDCVVAMEFLEHVDADLEVLGRIRSGTRVYATLPNFPYTSHVRYFSSEQDVASRYAGLLADFRVDTFLENRHGKTYYLIEGKAS